MSGLSLNLNQLRRWAIFNRTRISYTDVEGRGAVVNAQGIVEIPNVSGRPGYSVDEVLRNATEFVLQADGSKAPPRRLSREEVSQLVAAAAGAQAADTGHDE